MLCLPEPRVRKKIVRVFSFGGGVQSHAVLVLQALGLLPEPYDFFVMADVGRDSENPATVRYIDEVTRPYADRHGIPFVEVSKLYKGEPETLLEHIYRTKRSVPIPMRMSNGAPGNRSCTFDFKIDVVDRWVKARGWMGAIVGLGISIDEGRRKRDEKWHKTKVGVYKRREHILIDLKYNRNHCHTLIAEAGLPTPPKSACWFCPFTSRGEWTERKRNQPELFQQAVELEQFLNEKRGAMGRDYVYLHPLRQGQMYPLDQAVGDQMSLFEETCDSGYCFV